MLQEYVFIDTRTTYSCTEGEYQGRKAINSVKMQKINATIRIETIY